MSWPRRGKGRALLEGDALVALEVGEHDDLRCEGGKERGSGEAQDAGASRSTGRGREGERETDKEDRGEEESGREDDGKEVEPRFARLGGRTRLIAAEGDEEEEERVSVSAGCSTAR